MIYRLTGKMWQQDELLVFEAELLKACKPEELNALLGQELEFLGEKFRIAGVERFPIMEFWPGCKIGLAIGGEEVSQHQLDFKVAAKAYVDALIKVQDARRERDSAAENYEKAKRVSVEAKKTMAKFVGQNIRTRATTLPTGKIVVVIHAETEPICQVWDENGEEVRS